MYIYIYHEKTFENYKTISLVPCFYDVKKPLVELILWKTFVEHGVLPEFTRLEEKKTRSYLERDLCFFSSDCLIQLPLTFFPDFDQSTSKKLKLQILHEGDAKSYDKLHERIYQMSTSKRRRTEDLYMQNTFHDIICNVMPSTCFIQDGVIVGGLDEINIHKSHIQVIGQLSYTTFANVIWSIKTLSAIKIV